MPIFPGPVSHNNPDAPIVNATGNQVVGFGFFSSISARNNLAAGTSGYWILGYSW